MGERGKPDVGKDVGKLLASTVVLSQIANVGRDLWGMWSVAISCTVAVLYLVWVAARSDYLNHVRRFGVAGVGVAYAASLFAVTLWESAPLVAQVGLPASVWVLAAVLLVRIVAPESRFDTLRTLSGVAAIGFSVSLVGLGIGVFLDGYTLSGVAVIVLSICGAGIGIGVLLDGLSMIGVAASGLGISCGVAGIWILLDGDTLSGVAAIGFGISCVVGGIGNLLDGTTLTWVGLIGQGISVVGYGIGVLLDGYTLGGVAGIGLGISLVVLGIGILFDNALLWVGFIVTGVLGVGLGIGYLLDGDTFGGVAMMGLGISGVGFGSWFVSARRRSALSAVEVKFEQLVLFDIPDSRGR